MKKLKPHKERKEPGIRWFIWGLLVGVLIWFGWDMPHDEYMDTRAIWMFLVIMGPGLLGGVLCYIPIIVRKRREEKLATAEAIANGRIPVASGAVRHIGGLPVPTNVPCKMTVFADRMELTSSSQDFRLSMDKVIGAEQFVDTEMRQHIQRNTGGAIFGGLMFGAAGAIVGGMPESRYRREISKYNILLNYVDDAGTIQAVVMTSEDPVRKLVDAINRYHSGFRPNTTIEL